MDVGVYEGGAGLSVPIHFLQNLLIVTVFVGFCLQFFSQLLLFFVLFSIIADQPVPHDIHLSLQTADELGWGRQREQGKHEGQVEEAVRPDALCNTQVNERLRVAHPKHNRDHAPLSQHDHKPHQALIAEVEVAEQAEVGVKCPMVRHEYRAAP